VDLSSTFELPVWHVGPEAGGRRKDARTHRREEARRRDKIVELLLKADAHVTYDGSESLLWNAAVNGYTTLVRRLVMSSGVDIDREYRFALIDAVEGRDTTRIKAVLDKATCAG